MANHLQHRGGLDFFALARGSERSYSTSFLINLDPDLMALAAPAHLSTYDLYMAAIIGHTQRIFSLIQSKSKRVIDQFCFGFLLNSLALIAFKGNGFWLSFFK